MKTIKAGIALLIMMSLMTPWVSGQTPHIDSLKAYILTPPSPVSPRLTGATIFGARPGSQFIYSITATGLRPLKYSVTGLPK